MHGTPSERPRSSPPRGPSVDNFAIKRKTPLTGFFSFSIVDEPNRERRKTTACGDRQGASQPRSGRVAKVCLRKIEQPSKHHVVGLRLTHALGSPLDCRAHARTRSPNQTVTSPVPQRLAERKTSASQPRHWEQSPGMIATSHDRTASPGQPDTPFSHATSVTSVPCGEILANMNAATSRTPTTKRARAHVPSRRVAQRETQDMNEPHLSGCQRKTCQRRHGLPLHAS